MTAVTVMLLLILTGLYYSSKVNFERRSMEQLRFAIRDDGPPGAEPGVPSEKPFAAPSKDTDAVPLGEPSGKSYGKQSNSKKEGVPTLVVDVSDDGRIQILKNRFSELDEETVEPLISLAASSKEPQGMIRESSLRYLREPKSDGTTRYAFADISVEQSSLKTQLLHSAAIGLLAAAVFFFISALLSRWMVKPVEDAFDRQRQFVADASHELKTPLTVILSNVNMMASSLPSSDEKNGSRLERIGAEAARMRQLVEHLLLLARSDSGVGTTALTPQNFSYIVNSSVMTFEPLIFETGRCLSDDIEDGIRINGDSKKLRQLIDILLDNACKYSDQGSEIVIRLYKTSAREVCCSVKSKGRPLAKEELETIFERFYRSSESRGECQGYGLGLSIARTIADEHGGSIWAQSDVNGFNTFFVRFSCLT